VEGDTLYNLAIAYNVDLTCLEDANPQVADPNLIFPGEVISVPANCPPFNLSELPTMRTGVITTSLISSSTSRQGTTTPTMSNSVTDTMISSTTYTTCSNTFTKTDSGRSTTAIGSPTIHSPPTAGSTTITSLSGTIAPGTPPGSSGTESTPLPPVTESTTGTSLGGTIHTPKGPNSSGTGRPTTTSSGGSVTEVVIEGSTFTIGPGAITMTEDDGTEVTIESSEIIVGMSTIHLPTVSGLAPITITTDGITFTLQTTTLAPSTVTTTPTSSLEVAVIGSSTYTIGPIASTVTSGGTTYVIGGESGGIVVGTDTFTNFPAGSTTLVSDGITLTVGPTPTISYPTIGVAAISALQPLATQVVNAIAAGAAEIASYASGQSETAAGLGSLLKSLTLAADRRFDFFCHNTHAKSSTVSESFVAAAASIELTTLSIDGQAVVTNGKEAAEDAETFFRNELVILRNKAFTFKRKARLLLAALVQYLWLIAIMAIIALAIWAASGSSGSSSSLSSSISVPTTTTSSATSTTTSFSSTPTEYFIATKPGTPLALFKGLELGLPNDGAEIVYPNVPFQGYVTNITMLEASAVAFLPFVGTVWPNLPLPGPGDDESSNPTSEGVNARRASSLGKRLAPFSGNVEVQPGSPDHLKIVSQTQQDRRENRLNDYQWDPSNRRTIRLYIVDKGFNLDHEVRTLYLL